MTFRKLEARDQEVYISLASAFYRSDAVLHPVPMQNIENTFAELMKRDTYA